MAGALSSLDPHKVVLPIVALIGLVPVFLQYRDSSKLFVVGYALLIVATLVTNLENLFLGTVLNYSEHYLGLLGSGVAFLAAAYVRRKRILAETGGPDGGPGGGTDGAAAERGEPDQAALADGGGIDR